MRNLSAHSKTCPRLMSGITALPRWENIRNSLHAPIGTASGAPIIENGVFKRGLGRLGGSTPAGDEKPCLLRTIIWCMVVVTILVLEIVLRAVLGTLVGPSTSTPQPSVTELPDGSTPTPTLNGTGTSSPKLRIDINPRHFRLRDAPLLTA